MRATGQQEYNSGGWYWAGLSTGIEGGIEAAGSRGKLMKGLVSHCKILGFSPRSEEPLKRLSMGMTKI
jgi:hypothetical protein